MLEETLRKFLKLKMSIEFKCPGLKVELRFCSFLGCVNYRTCREMRKKEKKKNNCTSLVKKLENILPEFESVNIKKLHAKYRNS